MVFSTEKQKVTKLGKKERAARKELAWQHVSREHTLVERARRLHAIRTDVGFHHNFGWPVMGAHFAFWSINRMLDQAVKSQQRIADIYGAPKEAFGIWLGVDKLSRNPGHYEKGMEPHGVHTLMKGLALRLEHLAEHTETPGVILMEGDATPVEALPRIMPDLVPLLEKVDFVWLGYFISERPTNKTNTHGA
jgi:hypothetical protein